MKNIRVKDNFRVTILGSGTCVPSLERSSCSVLVEINGVNIVMDFGAGTMHRLLQAGVSIFEVDYIFFSHLHPDHTGELVSFLFANKYSCGDYRQKPLTIVGAKGFSDFFNQLALLYREWIRMKSDRFQLIELDKNFKDQHTFEGFSIDSAPVAHIDGSIAYRINGLDTKSMVYSGDTDKCSNLVDLAQNTDLFICECALPDELKTAGHLTPYDAGQMATRANVKHLVLTHLYPECQKAHIHGQCRKSYNGQLSVARDLMRFQLY